METNQYCNTSNQDHQIRFYCTAAHLMYENNCIIKHVFENKLI